jgi:hypothetical protein
MCLWRAGKKVPDGFFVLAQAGKFHHIIMNLAGQAQAAS